MKLRLVDVFAAVQAEDRNGTPGQKGRRGEYGDVADIIRGVEINKALGILRYSKKEASIRMEKLLKSAIANWEAKNENERLEDTKLCVKEIFVDGGRMLKRIQAAPQGRAHRIRKRSNHVTIVVDKMVTEEKK